MSKFRNYQGFTLSSGERLKLRNDIETLFRQGEAFSVFPLRLVYKFSDTEDDVAPVRVGFSIPKKRIRHANGRNRIRRLLKEAWRHRKSLIFPHIPAGRQLHCFLIYTGSPIVKEFTLLHANDAVDNILKKLQQRLPKDTEGS